MMMCDGTSHGDNRVPTGPRMVPRRWRASFNYGYSSTNVFFDSNQTASLSEHAAIATLQYRSTSSSTFQIAAGGILGGALVVGDRPFTLGTGWTGSLAISRRIMDGRGAAPFVLFDMSVSAASVPTRSIDSVGSEPGSRLLAIDIRTGLTVGKTFFDFVSPYVAGRLFGGPIFWITEQGVVTGTDAYHYQVAVGLVVTLARRLDIYAEGVPLGERRISAGMGFAF